MTRIGRASFGSTLVISSLVMIACASTDPATDPGDGLKFAIRGKVSHNDLSPFGGVLIGVGTRLDTTDANGEYAIDALPKGEYIVTPTIAGISFTPGSITVQIVDADVGSQNFVEAVAAAPKLELILVQPGTFVMGEGDGSRTFSYSPAHTVHITRPFYMAKYELKQMEYSALMGPYPEARSEGDSFPATDLTMALLAEFCNRLSIAEGLDPACSIEGNEVTVDVTKSGYRFPTEAEWEYACRAGTTGETYYGPLITTPESARDSTARLQGWFRYQSTPPGDKLSRPHKVGLRDPSPWGFYDIYGNAEEFTADSWIDGYEAAEVSDPYRHIKNGTSAARGGGVDHGGPFGSHNKKEYPLNLRAAVATIRAVRTKL